MREARPWRNGGGVTREIAMFPESAGDDDFLWRASLATIAAAGPFSAWPGVDRTFLLVQGEVALTFNGGAECRVSAGDPATGFAGEAAVAARPVGGECTALNIMARRGRMRARVDRWESGRPAVADQILLVAEVATSVRHDGRSFDLEADDALLVDRGGIAAMEFDHPIIVALLSSS